MTINIDILKKIICEDCEKVINFYSDHYNNIELSELIKDAAKYKSEIKKKYDGDYYIWSIYLIFKITLFKSLDVQRRAVKLAESITDLTYNTLHTKYPKSHKMPCNKANSMAWALDDIFYAKEYLTERRYTDAINMACLGVVRSYKVDNGIWDIVIEEGLSL